jgi:cell wall-associated NlpC family hydrolase
MAMTMLRRGVRSSVAALAAVAVAALCGGCGQSGQRPAGSRSSGRTATSATNAADAVPRAHPQAVEPVAGATARSGGRVPQSASVSVSTPGQRSLPQPESISEIRRQLTASGMTASPNQATLTSGGLAIAPVGAPAQVQEVIAAGNQIARLPYIWGGGHMTYEDTGYDCSGSLSYVLAAAHLLDHTMTSDQLMRWGRPGPGKWITVFATDGHTFMYVAGLRFDTVALAETGSRWSNRSADEPDLSSFVQRHPAGL